MNIKKATAANAGLPASDSALPLYHQAYLLLRTQILDGSIGGDSQLPGEKKLASQYEVSRETIRRALEMLENDNLIERRQGVGTRVTPYNHRPEKLNDLGGITRNTANLDGISQYPTDSAETVATPKRLQKLFGTQAEIARVIRIRKSGDTPYSITTFYLPLAIISNLDPESFDDKPILQSMNEAGFQPIKAEQTINATAADNEQAAILNIPVGSPLIVMTGTFYDEQDNTCAFNEGYFRPEYYEYRNVLYRLETENGIRWVPKN